MIQKDSSFNKQQLENVLEQVENNFQNQRPIAELWQYIHHLPAWQMADLIEALPLDQQLSILQVLLNKNNTDPLSYLNTDVLSEIIENFDHEQIAKALNSLTSDDAVDILENLDIEEQRSILKFLAPQQRDWIEENLSYPNDSAGRIMQREILSMPSFWTVHDAIHYFQTTNVNWHQLHNIIFLENSNGTPMGIVSSTQLLQAHHDKTLSSLADTTLKTVHLYSDQKSILDLFHNYELHVVGVINENNQLMGAVFLNNVLAIAEEEYESDLLNLGGVRKNDFFNDVLQTTGLRFPWLVLNLGTALLSSLVIGNFSSLIAGFVSLVTFMPLIASLAGNAGTQAMTVMIRTLSTDNILITRSLNMYSKELSVSLIQGMGVAVLLGIISWFYYKDFMLSITCAISVFMVIVLAEILGITIPLILKKLKLDPAAASSVFLTAITDVSSFAIFLGLATYFVLHV